MEEDDSILVTVFTGTLWEAELVKGLLESNGIPAMVREGMLEAIAANLLEDNAVLVTDDREAEAKKIIEQRDKPEVSPV